MGHIKKYSDFVKETDTVGHDEPKASKPTALSEKLCEMFEKCWEMAMAEAKTWHDDEHKEHTAEGYAMECDSYVKECMENLMTECGQMMIQDTPNTPDGGMRQGTVQDVPVTSGAVR